MITAGGTDITILGAPGHVINGNGQAWWDGQGSNGGQPKPDHFFVAENFAGTANVIRDLNIENYPTVRHFRPSVTLAGPHSNAYDSTVLKSPTPRISK
jgi:hypothetical protein